MMFQSSWGRPKYKIIGQIGGEFIVQTKVLCFWFECKRFEVFSEAESYIRSLGDLRNPVIHDYNKWGYKIL